MAGLLVRLTAPRDPEEGIMEGTKQPLADIGGGTQLDWAMFEREQLHVVEFGPLTEAEAESIREYELWCEESEAEWLAREAAGGLSVCPECGQRRVRERSVCTLGYPGHPGAEFSVLYECEACTYKEL